MAHTLCPNGHSMWNGDGKVCVDAYPEEAIKRLSEQRSNIKFGNEEGEISLLIDIYSLISEKEPEIWRCTECKGLAIFLYNKNKGRDDERYDYIMVDPANYPSREEYLSWKKYYVENEDAFEDHHENWKNKGLTPYESFLEFEKNSDKLNYAYLKPDKKLIVITDHNDNPFRLYKFKKHNNI